MSSDFWFVDREGNQRGPVEKDEIIRLIKDGAITRESLLWADGMDEWRAGGQVEALASFFKPSPPPPRSNARRLRALVMVSLHQPATQHNLRTFSGLNLVPKNYFL